MAGGRRGVARPQPCLLHSAGTALDAGNIRRSFRAITKASGVGEDWTPREMRHTFVSTSCDHDVPIETIAELVGHASTAVTEKVYPHQLRPVITTGATTMNAIFKQQKQQNQAQSA